MIRRFGEPVRQDVKYILRPGAYGILFRRNNLLLTFQEEPEPELQLPGGGIDPGESPLVALNREVAEETGWRIARPRLFGRFRRFVHMPEYDLWAEKICSVYVADPVLRLGDPLETGHSAHWIPIAQAPSLLANPGDRHFTRLFSSLAAR